MKPIHFACEEILNLPPEQIAANILDLTKWCEFEGYGMMPGIKSAEFETRTAEVVGTRIRVVNTDGSSHVEEIVEWEPSNRLGLRLEGFSPPLSRLASHFLETWEFSPSEDSTKVVRSFELHPKSILTKPALWMISFLVKKALAQHLRQMQDELLANAG